MKVNPEMLFVLWAMATAAIGGETPIKSLKLTGDMNAGGHAITNLAPGLLPSSPATVAQVNETNVANTAAVKEWAAGVVNDAVTAEALARAAGDLVAMTNWQAIVYSLTNGAALGATALQPSWAATGTVAHAVTVTGPQSDDLVTAAAHAATEHSVTADGGFQAGSGANASTGGAVGYYAGATDGGGAVGAGAVETGGGGAVGYYAGATDGGGAVGAGANASYGGAVGAGANANYGGAVGYGALATDGGAVGAGANANYGGAVGYGALATDGGAVGANAKTSDGFAGGKDAYATSDGTILSNPIDAIQLGSGGNSTPLTLQIYSNRLLNADGTIPVERFAATLNASNAADRAYADAAVNAAPAWIGITNLAAAVTITNSFERPVYLYSTGTVAVAFSGLRTPMPLYLVLRGPDSLTFPGAYYVGGGSWQTNMSNHFVVWKYGTNLFINPVTATED